MSSPLDELTSRLSQIHDELAALPCGASPQRYALLTERDALRRAAASYRSGVDDSRSTKELEAELASLKKRRKQSIALRTGFVTSKGGGSHSPSPGAWVKLSSQALAGDDLSRVNARIAQIEDALFKRRSSKT